MATATATHSAIGIRCRLLSEVEAAERLNLPRRTLSTWRQRGVGPRYVKLNETVVRYLEAALDEFVSAGMRENTSQKKAP